MWLSPVPEILVAEYTILKLYQKLNHLFIAGEGMSAPREYNVEGHVDAEVVSDIARWVLKA